MPVTALFEHSVPAPFDTDFTDGELAVSVFSDIDGATSEGSYSIARFFDFRGGVYVFKALSVEAAVWYVGPGDNTLRRFFTSTVENGVVTTTVYLPPGRHRIDINLLKLDTAEDQCYFAFSIRQGGALLYASSEDGWVRTTGGTTPPQDGEVPALGDYRLLMPRFTMRPNWADGMTERLEWKTDVLSSEASVEQRRGIRRFFRRSLEVAFLRQEHSRAWLDNFFVGIGKNTFLTPLWYEQFHLTSALAASSSSFSFPSGTLAMREFAEEDLIIFQNGSHLEYEVARIDSISGDTVYLGAATASAWPQGSTVTPFLPARFLEPPAMDNATDTIGLVRTRFYFRRLVELAAAPIFEA